MRSDPVPESTVNRHHCSRLIIWIEINVGSSGELSNAAGLGERARRCNLLSIRLTRMGAKKRPFYRIVVTEKRSKRDGRFVESVGYYDPCRNPADVKINRERVKYWIERGAQPSETVRSLINRKVESPSADTLA